MPTPRPDRRAAAAYARADAITDALLFEVPPGSPDCSGSPTRSR